jgi:hypothetical protein
VADERGFEALVRMMFMQRRKTLLNALGAYAAFRRSMPRRRSTRRTSIHAAVRRPCNLQNWRGLRTISFRLPDHLCYSLAGFHRPILAFRRLFCGWRSCHPSQRVGGWTL